jgi:hypothetical protein
MNNYKIGNQIKKIFPTVVTKRPLQQLLETDDAGIWGNLTKQLTFL